MGLSLAGCGAADPFRVPGLGSTLFRVEGLGLRVYLSWAVGFVVECFPGLPYPRPRRRASRTLRESEPHILDPEPYNHWAACKDLKEGFTIERHGK